MAVVLRITLTLYLCSTTIGHHPKTVPPPRIAHPAPYSPAGSVALLKNCGGSSNCHSGHQVPHRRYGVEFEKFSKFNRRGKYTRNINKKNILKYRNTPKVGSPNHHHFSFPNLDESEVPSATNSIKPEENTAPNPLQTINQDKKNDSYHFIFHKITIGKQIPRTVAAMTLVYDPKSQYADLNFSTNETANPTLKNTSNDQMSSQNHNLVSTSEKELKITSGSTDRRRQKPSKRKCKGCRESRRKNIDTLDTFEKQMKFLRRWERRLYRHSNE